MSAALRRSADLERATARALHSRRTARIGERRAVEDVAAIVVGDVTMQPECKARKKLPKLITGALQQAKRYNPRAVPLAVLRELGGRALVALELGAFVALLGIDPAALPTRHRPTRRVSARQTSLFGAET